MDALIPYIGTALVILAATIAIVILGRRGIHLKKVKHDKTEVEFEHVSQRPIGGASKSALPVGLTEAMVQLSPAARQDCGTLGLAPEEPVQFVLDEATRHPILFGADFISLPLVFHENVLLLSWDKTEARIERVLGRKEAYPLNDAWGSCLSAYRQATLLPYRSRWPEQQLTITEIKRAIPIYRKLAATIQTFQGVLHEHGQDYPDSYQGVSPLIDEAEFSLSNEDFGTAVARLEAVLSTAHKFILDCAPQGPSTVERGSQTHPKIQEPGGGGLMVLVVDDDVDMVEFLKLALEKNGYTVAATASSTEALKAMVDHEFDLVITDVVMPVADGREVAIAAKKSSNKIKVVAFTGFPQLSADLRGSGVDVILSKPTNLGDLLSTIDKLLGNSGDNEKDKTVEGHSSRSGIASRRR